MRRYVLISADVLVRLLVAVAIDMVEYVIAILLVPMVGDIFDIVGTIACVLTFGWIGLLSVIEFVPYLDILPTCTITFLVWYYLKKKEEERSIRMKIQRL